MADLDLPDEIIGNILVRLNAKQLLRCRCVSKHWNNLISDPSFMKLRSRPQILYLAPPLYLLNENDPDNSPAKLDYYPFNENLRCDVMMLGTFNGVVVFVDRGPDSNLYNHLQHYNTRHIFIYNPFTRALKVVPDPYSHLQDLRQHAYGFTYGSTDDDDLKIVKFGRFIKHANNRRLKFWNTCNVLDLKTCSWSISDILVTDIGHVFGRVATFLDGFLYWITSTKMIALHVKKMAISEMNIPPAPNCHLGTLHGRLCAASTDSPLVAEFHMWIMKKEENSWSKAYSFTLRKEVIISVGPCIGVMSVLDDGRIVMSNYSGGQVIVYDLLKHSSKIFNLGFFNYIDYIRCATYMETLVSPSDICVV